MPDYRTMANMLAMVRRLEGTHSGRLPVNELAHELRVHRRTVLRWLAALEQEWVGDDGVPVVRRDHVRGRAWAVLVAARAPVTATIFQYAAAYAATRHLAGSPVLAESAEDVLDRVQAGLPRTLHDLVPRVARAFHYVPFAPKDPRGSEEVVDALVQALIRSMPVEVAYTSAAGRTSTRTLHPWSLVMYRDGLYVLAPPARGRRLALYAVERIRSATVDRSGRFEVPADFDPEQEFARHMGIWRDDAVAERVVVAFEPSVATTVRSRRWRGFVAFETAEDGRLRLSLDVPVTPEIVSWVLSWGGAAEAVAPEVDR